MASHENSRKKRKVTYMNGQTAAQATTPPIASSSALPPPLTTMNNMHPTNTACHHEQALKALNTDLDAMRQLITCKICDRLLYEPYALSCGHTYCYSCLSQWLGSNAKMTCPDCRTVIRQQPTPSYLIRELVLIFVSRNELLPDGETAEEHNEAVRDEAEIVTKDRENKDPRKGGLFNGRFNRLTRLLGPVRDVTDGVDRCPECHWELEDGHCIQCGYDDDTDDNFSLGESGSGISDEEVDLELRDMDDADGFVGADAEDNWGYEGPYRPGPPHRDQGRWLGQPHRNGRLSPIDLAADSDDSSLEDDEYDQNDTFIDDGTVLEGEEEGSSDDGYDSDATAGRNPAPADRRGGFHRLAAPVLISDDEDDEDYHEESAVRAQAPTSRNATTARRRRTGIAIPDDEDEDGEETAPSTTQGAHESSSESDSEDEGPVVRGSQRNKRSNVAARSRGAVTVSSSDDESEESSHYGADDAPARGGFSPIDHEVQYQASEQTDYDDDEDNDEIYGNGDAFNPYELDDDSNGGYEDQSDDGWGRGIITTRAAGQFPAAPSARLGTLQQRRPRRISPQYRSASISSPSILRGDTRPLYQPSRGLRDQPNNFHPLHTIRNRAIPPPLASSAPQCQSQSSHAHPFQLGNVLNGISVEQRRQQQQRMVADALRSNSYNQRNQQARMHPYQRNVPAPTNPTGAGAGVQLGSSLMRNFAGSSSDARRKRALGVASDDEQDFYV